MATPLNLPTCTDAFLAQAGWADSRLEPLAGDASFRRYFRVYNGPRSAILMNEPREADTLPFLHMADWLRTMGLRAPRIEARDPAQGLILLEDFGETLLRDYLERNPANEAAAYRAAIAELVRLRDLPPPALRGYDIDEYWREARLLTEWFVPASGLSVDADAYERLWRTALAPLLTSDQRPVAVLRDYHSENLMMLADGTLGLLDFQDALLGHPAYDLVSLLQDARRDVAPALEVELLDHYCALTGEGDAFRRAYWLLGLQRNAKIVGIFTRLWRRDGKPRYLALLPRMWGLIERDLAQPHLASFRAWFDAYVPASARGALTAGDSA